MQCSAQTVGGTRCRAMAVHGSEVCHLHSQPGRAAVLGAMGGKGGAVVRARDLKQFRPPSTAQELQKLLAQTIVDVRTNALDPRSANSIAVLSGALIRSLEAGELEQRIQRLEERQASRDAALRRMA